MERYELRLLVEEASNGSQGAFATLYDQLYDQLYGYAYRRTYEIQPSEDIVANTFYKIMVHLPAFCYRHDSAFYAWVFKIAYNELQSYYRESNKNILVAEWLDVIDLDRDDPSVASRFDSDIAERDLRNAIELLRPIQREVVELYYFARLDHKTIGSIVGKREGTVRTILSRALQHLRATMNEHTTKEVTA